MKNLLLGLMALCLIATTPVFANDGIEVVKSTERAANTNFSVKVTSGTAALAGAQVNLYQNGASIGSAVTNSRGIAILTVPNQEAVTVKVAAKGHNPGKKENFIPTEGQIIPISLKKLTFKPGAVKPKK